MNKKITRNLLMLFIGISVSTYTYTNNTIFTEVSFGELIDKITILSIKSERIKDTKKLYNILTELETLENTLNETISLTPEQIELIKQLKQINEKIWVIEDDLRSKASSRI